MSPLKLAAIFAAAFVLCLGLFTPLSALFAWSAPARAVSAGKVEGGLLGGTLTDLRLGGLLIDEARVSVDPLALLTGALRLDARAKGGFTGRARLIRQGRRMGIEAAEGRLPLSALGLAGGGLAGEASLRDVSAQFGQGRCLKAGGRIEARIGATRALPRPMTLAGTPVCRGADWVLPLAGQAEGLRAEGEVVLNISGGWKSRIDLIPADPALGAGLAASGFTQDGDRWRRISEGRP